MLQVVDIDVKKLTPYLMCKIFTRRLLHIDFLMRILNDSPILLPSDFLLDSLSINYRNFSYRVRFVFINL